MKDKKFLKAIIFVVTLILLTVLLPLNAYGANYDVFIDDKANLLSDYEEQELKKDMSELAEYGNVMFISNRSTCSCWVCNTFYIIR